MDDRHQTWQYVCPLSFFLFFALPSLADVLLIIYPFGLAHGAVLRITRPDEVHTYMVDPQFPKRADAKNAVCLAALAAGVGAYVRAVSEALETKITPLERSLAYDSILPALTAEYAKFWPDKLPEMFEYTKDRDGMCDLFVPFAARCRDADDSYA